MNEKRGKKASPIHGCLLNICTIYFNMFLLCSLRLLRTFTFKIVCAAMEWGEHFSRATIETMQRRKCRTKVFEEGMHSMCTTQCCFNVECCIYIFKWEIRRKRVPRTSEPSFDCFLSSVSMKRNQKDQRMHSLL